MHVARGIPTVVKVFGICRAPGCIEECAPGGYCGHCAPRFPLSSSKAAVSRYREGSDLEERLAALSSGASYLYCLSCDDYLKFGVARNVEQRIRELQCGNPSPITLVGAMKCVRRLERDVHIRLSADRVRGEWFKKSPDTLALVGIITSGDIFGLYKELGLR